VYSKLAYEIFKYVIEEHLLLIKFRLRHSPLSGELLMNFDIDLISHNSLEEVFCRLFLVNELFQKVKVYFWLVSHGRVIDRDKNGLRAIEAKVDKIVTAIFMHNLGQLIQLQDPTRNICQSWFLLDREHLFELS